MFKKLLIVLSFCLLSACSSFSGGDVRSDEVIGEEITPINLSEQNLSLTGSKLFLIVNKSDEEKQSKSSIKFSIEYTTVNSSGEKDEQAAISTYNVVVLNSDKIEDKLQALILDNKETLEENEKIKDNKKSNKESENVVEPVAEEEVTIETRALKSTDVSQNCSDETCQVTQIISFEVDTSMLIDAQENGFVFLLKTKEGDEFLETMIPASYLKTLLSGNEAQSMSE